MQDALRIAENKDEHDMMGFGYNEAQRDNEELEQMYQMNLEAKDAQLADMENEYNEMKNEFDIQKLQLDFLTKANEDLNIQLHEKDMKLEFLDEAKECIRELTNKVSLLSEQKSSLEGSDINFKTRSSS